MFFFSRNFNCVLPRALERTSLARLQPTYISPFMIFSREAKPWWRITKVVTWAKLARTHALNTGTRRKQQPPVAAQVAFNVSTTTNDNNCKKQIQAKYHFSSSIATVLPPQTRNHIWKPKKKTKKSKKNKQKIKQNKAKHSNYQTENKQLDLVLAQPFLRCHSHAIS